MLRENRADVAVSHRADREGSGKVTGAEGNGEGDVRAEHGEGRTWSTWSGCVVKVELRGCAGG